MLKLLLEEAYAVWLYFRFNLSHRDIEDLLAERGITVSREAIRLWRTVDQDGDFWMLMQLSRIYLILVGTWLRRNTIEISGQVRLPLNFSRSPT